MNESYTDDDFPECKERKVNYIQNINGQNKYNKKDKTKKLHHEEEKTLYYRIKF
jgi:hypothetical protein